MSLRALRAAVHPVTVPLRRGLDRLLGSRFQEWLWRYRHLVYKPRMAETYLGSVDHPHRKAVVEAVASTGAPRSILEVGCSSGPNLVLLAELLPEAALHGIDINRRSVRVGQAYLERVAPGRVKLRHGTADDLGAYDDKSMDVVFTDAVMMFVAPDKIRRVLAEMLRVARRGIVLNEYGAEQPPANNYDGGRYVYDYATLIGGLAPTARVTTFPSPFTGGLWDKYGRLITVELESGEGVAHE